MGYGNENRGYGRHTGQGVGSHSMHRMGCYRRDYESAATKEEKKEILETWLKHITERSNARKAELGKKLNELD